ncbi:MAG TPA: non-canonical purine NTP pyrophosphatase [Candidatus Elarobacter sp.]|nr:non-canonical purine NTP pyrophosphatase [Candidatus Elarobacter sp.]
MIYVATRNAGKLREMDALFAGSGFALATYDRYLEPVEGETSYAENAALKARTLHQQLREAELPANVLADDSGLEVYALDGAPGVMTAYYGGVGRSWTERRRLLLSELHGSGSADRSARFVCALHFISEGGREFGALATVEGEIAREDGGVAGFSFDPVFLYPPAGRTFAELDEAEKNRVSHRAVAAAGLLATLRAAGIRPWRAPETQEPGP